jgi:hypothetical protein
MNKENKVSIWFGHFESKGKFYDFIREIYDDEGNMHSSFMESFGIDFIDNQFQETLFDNEMNKSKLEPASYSESFIDKITIDFLKYNCVILLYNFEYEGLVEKVNSMDFYGVLNYTK